MELMDKIGRGLQSGTLKMSSSASSFTSLAVAEKAISGAMKANRWKIRRWAKSTVSDHDSLYLEFNYLHSSTVGIVVPVSTKIATETNKLTVVLHKKTYNRKPYYILTAYPRVR